jgi:hypothetical protein
MNRVFTAVFYIVAIYLFSACEDSFLDLTKGEVTINEVNGRETRGPFIVVIAKDKVYRVGDNIYDGTEFGANGNNNGSLDPGETISYIFHVRNVGNRDAIAVNIVISTDDPWVTDLQNTHHYLRFIESSRWRNERVGSFSRGDNLLISIDDRTPRGHRLNFKIAISDADGNSWHDYFIIIVN